MKRGDAYSISSTKKVSPGADRSKLQSEEMHHYLGRCSTVDCRLSSIPHEMTSQQPIIRSLAVVQRYPLASFPTSDWPMCLAICPRLLFCIHQFLRTQSGATSRGHEMSQTAFYGKIWHALSRMPGATCSRISYCRGLSEFEIVPLCG